MALFFFFLNCLKEKKYLKDFVTYAAMCLSDFSQTGLITVLKCCCNSAGTGADTQVVQTVV